MTPALATSSQCSIAPREPGVYALSPYPFGAASAHFGFAGRLIDQAGMKGTIHGKAQISQRHANFIVNLGGASAADVIALIVEARKRVLDQFGVELELEVELRGEWGIGTP